MASCVASVAVVIEEKVDHMARSSAQIEQLTEESRDSGKSLMKGEKKTGTKTDFYTPLQHTRKERLCGFKKFRKCVCQKGKNEKTERPAEISSWKRAECQINSEAFEKSIVAKIVQDHNFVFAKPIRNILRQEPNVIEGKPFGAEPAGQ